MESNQHFSALIAPCLPPSPFLRCTQPTSRHAQTHTNTVSHAYMESQVHLITCSHWYVPRIREHRYAHNVYRDAPIYTHSITHTHTHTALCMHIHTHTPMHSHTHLRTHTHPYAFTHMRAYEYITHTGSYTQTINLYTQ